MSDPTDSGGLFTNNQRKKNYSHTPVYERTRSQRFNRCLAFIVALVLIILGLSFWGPLPLLGLWIGAQVQYFTNSPNLGILTAFLATMFLLFMGLLIARRLDEAWILLRRAGGHDQQDGLFTRVFAITCFVGLIAFSIWLIFFSAASLAPTGAHL
jgi:hypothetical protein